MSYLNPIIKFCHHSTQITKLSKKESKHMRPIRCGESFLFVLLLSFFFLHHQEKVAASKLSGESRKHHIFKMGFAFTQPELILWLQLHLKIVSISTFSRESKDLIFIQTLKLTGTEKVGCLEESWNWKIKLISFNPETNSWTWTGPRKGHTGSLREVIYERGLFLYRYIYHSSFIYHEFA